MSFDNEDGNPEATMVREKLATLAEKVDNGQQVTNAELGEALMMLLNRDTAQETAEEQTEQEKRETSPARSVASRLNGLQSRGPITEKGRQIARANLRQERRPTRLAGLAEAKTLSLDPGAAEKLYRELIAPYEPAPALLAMHFQDLARAQLELQALERVRDARLEDRAEQADLERRRHRREVRRQLAVTVKEVFAKGLQHLDPSPANFSRQLLCLEVLKYTLQRDGKPSEAALKMLYGTALDPAQDRAQVICRCCQRLMSTDPKDHPTPREFENLEEQVDEEYSDALNEYILLVDEKSMSRSAVVSRLAPTQNDLWMDRRADQLRRAIDRKHWVIVGLLQMYGLAGRPPAEGSKPSGPGSPESAATSSAATPPAEASPEPSGEAAPAVQDAAGRPGAPPSPPLKSSEA